MSQKLYVITRADLSKSQQAVQAGHALAEFCLKGSVELHWNGREMERNPLWENGTLVYLKVKNLDELQKLYGKIEKSFAFHEPDMNNELTAFARLGNHPEFIGLPLL